MTNPLNDHMGGYVLSHRPQRPGGPHQSHPAVTISREAGAGGSSVATRLAAYLDQHQPPETGPWAVFDQNLVGKALEQHRLPGHLEQYMPEDAKPLLPDTLEDLLGLHPAASELVRDLSETMLNLARHGNVILVGRGGNIVTARLPNVIHVRLVAPYAQRLKYVGKLLNYSPDEAAKFVTKTDRARKRFLQQNFGADVDDPALYDLTINTSRFDFDTTAKMIGDVALSRQARVGDADEDAARRWALAAGN